jgi:Gas vesicle synthesis protein GvpL/GvpF
MSDELALWAYGVVRAGAELPPLTSTVAGEHPVERVAHRELAVLVSPVPRSDFAEEPLHRHLNDLAWLEQVARAHEAVLDQALAHATVVPLRLATIFAGESSAAAMLEAHAEVLHIALAGLAGRQEWSVKLLVDPDALLASAGEAEAEHGAPGSGAAYLLRRRAERDQRAAAGRLAASIAEDVHARLQDWAIDAVLRPAQNRELSGHQGEMLLNGAYLVDASEVARLREIVAELAERHAALGARIELAGPFPPYNFVPALEA